ncbi:MAG: iron-sulfur cluster assembly scaffold protein [Vicinamibacterales bacterium]
MTAPYSEAVRARCRDPRRAGGWPDGETGIGTGAAGSLDAGALTRLQVRLSGGGDTVEDARFRVFGCSAAVASASFVADAIVGGSSARARALEAAEVADALALPADKRAMARLATDAARAAVEDWETRHRDQEPGTGDQG